MLKNTTQAHHSLKLTSPTQQKGSLYEQFAYLFLQQAGMSLIAQNWLQPKVGELDLVMLQSANPPAGLSAQSQLPQKRHTHWQAKVWDTLVFVEVKARIHQPTLDINKHEYERHQHMPMQQQAYGDAMASVTASKQKKLVKTAHCFLQKHPQYHDCECRFDVVAFNLDVNRDKALQQLISLQTPINCQPDVDESNTATIDWAQWKPYINWIQGAFLAQAW